MSAQPGISPARNRYDVIGASEGPDLGSINPDSAAFLIRALADHLDRIGALMVANTQGKDEQVEVEVDASLIPAGGLSVKLPTGSAITSYHIENNGANVLTLYAGGSPAGRALNIIRANAYKVALVPQQTTSLTLTAATNAVGLVRALITTAMLSPVQGVAL